MLTDLKITWPEGVRVTKAYPHPLPDLFRGDQLVLTGRYTGHGAGEVVIEGRVNGRPHRIVQRVTFPERASANDFVPRLWATRRIGWLLDEIRLRGESAELRDEVVALARRHAIVTPYTSYLIVEDEARRGVPLAFRSLQSLDRDRAAQAQLKAGYDSLRNEKAGDAATFNARSQLALKNAASAEGAIQLNAFEVSAAVAGKAARAGSPRAVAAQNSVVVLGPPATAAGGGASTAERANLPASPAARVVNGKAFFQNGAQWIDAEAQQRPAAKTVRVAFASDAYFKLLAENPAAHAWLALGRNVQFTLGDTLYEITEE
jgi:Ca-activated chloride channel family protein